MNPHGVARIAGIIALIAQEPAGLDINLAGSRGEVGSDIGFSIGAGHMRIVSPDLSSWLQRIIRDADDQAGFPISCACQVAWVSCDDRGDIYSRAAENIDSLMAMPHSKRIVPQITYKTIGGKNKWRLPTPFSSANRPPGAACWIVKPGHNAR